MFQRNISPPSSGEKVMQAKIHQEEEDIDFSLGLLLHSEGVSDMFRIVGGRVQAGSTRHVGH
jgi:hypothetical protein